MTKLIPTLLAATSLVIASNAMAADLLVPSAPAMPLVAPAPNWQGLYLGAHVGYTWADVNDNPETINPDGAVFGLHAGYNLQFSNLVLGAEAFLTGVAGDDGYITGNGGGARLREASQQHWAGFMARAGWAFNNLLVYGTGGAVWQTTHFRRTVVNTGAVNPPGADADYNGVAWAAGVGAEMMIDRHMSVRLQYLHIEDPSVDTNIPNFDDVTKIRNDVVTLGLNFHLR